MCCFGVNGEECGSYVLLWMKKFGRRIGELRKGCAGEVSRVGVWKSEPDERLRFMDMVAVSSIVGSRWRRRG